MNGLPDVALSFLQLPPTLIGSRLCPLCCVFPPQTVVPLQLPCRLRCCLGWAHGRHNRKARVGGESSRDISSSLSPGSAPALEAADFLQYYSSSCGSPSPRLLFPLSCRNIISNLCPFCPKSGNGFLGFLASGCLITPCTCLSAYTSAITPSLSSPHLNHRNEFFFFLA